MILLGCEDSVNYEKYSEPVKDNFDAKSSPQIFTKEKTRNESDVFDEFLLRHGGSAAAHSRPESRAAEL